MDFSLNWSYINYEELRCDSVMIALKAMNSQLQLVFLRIWCDSLYWHGARNSSLGDNFWLTVFRLNMCKQSVRHVSTTKYLSSIVSSRTACRQILVFFLFFVFLFVFFLCLFNSHYLEKSVHGPGAKPFYTEKLTKCPWTRSIIVVCGPGPKRGSTDPQSMFCPHPF